MNILPLTAILGFSLLFLSEQGFAQCRGNLGIYYQNLRAVEPLEGVRKIEFLPSHGLRFYPESKTIQIEDSSVPIPLQGLPEIFKGYGPKYQIEKPLVYRFSPDGNYLIGAGGFTLDIWKARTGEYVGYLTAPDEHTLVEDMILDSPESGGLFIVTFGTFTSEKSAYRTEWYIPDVESFAKQFRWDLLRRIDREATERMIPAEILNAYVYEGERVVITRDHRELNNVSGIALSPYGRDLVLLRTSGDFEYRSSDDLSRTFYRNVKDDRIGRDSRHIAFLPDEPGSETFHTIVLDSNHVIHVFNGKPMFYDLAPIQSMDLMKMFPKELTENAEQKFFGPIQRGHDRFIEAYFHYGQMHLVLSIRLDESGGLVVRRIKR